MSEIKKMYCPSCGAPVSFESGREDTFCSHCGSQLYFQDDHLEVKLKHEERKMEHEEKMSDIDYKRISREADVKEAKLAIIIGAVGISFMFLMVLLLLIFS